MATQGEVVFQAVCEVIGGEPDGKVELRKDELERVHKLVFTAFKQGICEKKSGGQDDESLAKYIPGLVNNWLRKDTRLNGGTKYTAKNPGSRSGSGDESVRAMKTLLSMTEDPEAKAAIQLEIAKRIAEIKPKVELNVEALPPSLRHLANK